jgi:cytochrome P450
MTIAEASLDDAVGRILSSDPEALRNPWPVWQAVREQGPVFTHGAVTFVTRYDDVRRLAKDTRLSNGYHFGGGRANAIWERLNPEERVMHTAISEFESQYVSRSDGDAHDRLRKIMHRAFTPRRMATLTDRIREYTADILRDCQQQGEFDWMTEVAVRLPMMLIAELLGVPQTERETIRKWSNTLAGNRGGEDPAKLTRAHTAMMEFRRYVEEEVIPRRHELGGSDLARAFVDAENGETLTPSETTSQFVVLLFAGFETTSTLIGSGLRELLLHPDQWQLLLDDPVRADPAMEELLRWITPVQWIGRFATEDIEVAGQVIPAGQTVYPSLAMANRDPDQFEDPETFDLARANAKAHLSFGLGPHFCLGNNLAKLETWIVLEEVARHYPEVRLLDEDPPWGSNAMLRAIQHMPVDLGPRHGD